MHAKPSFAHRLQTAKMASSRTSAQHNGPRAQKNTAPLHMWLVYVNKGIKQLQIPRYTIINLIKNYNYLF